ncbi:MAG: FHA domain-containing protein, partial [Polyangiaceae bacterium]|nr:FHA domain-containing protein [Polyangiaceae bacterium]
TQLEELSQNAQEFMSNLANTEMGGFHTVVRRGEGRSRASRVGNAVRDRFNHMHLIKYSVACIAPNVQQTFQLVFSNIKPMIAGDASFKDVPVGIDPTTWPLDVNAQYTIERTAKNPVHPGGTFKVYGNFCWGGDNSRAEVYFLPKNQPAPPTVEGGDIETAKRAQQQLIAMNMRGKALEASDTFVEFQAPSDDKILLGSGDKAVVRLVVYDNHAKRTSPVDAKNILTLKASEAPFPFLWVGGGIFGFLIVLLLIVAIARAGGGKRRRAAAPPPAPVVAGYSSPQGYGAPAPQPYPAPAAPPQQPYPAPAPMSPQAGPPAAQGAGGFGAPQPQQPAAGDFMYGGQPPGGYGLTGAQPQHGAPPPNPYAAGAPAPAAGSRAVLSGTAGTFPMNSGTELLIGRDSARCQIILAEPRVSAVHATVRFDSGQILVRDEGSNNGTIVNGTRIAPGVMTPVPPGSILRFGPVEFVVRLE